MHPKVILHCWYQAIDQLNIKTCNMRDLLTDEKFSRADLITLQDPAHPEKWDISSFHYVKQRDISGMWDVNFVEMLWYGTI